MQDNMTPKAFREEYVRPAIDLYGSNQSITHLAVHAICQVDVLAEVVANHLGKVPRKYRDDLGRRLPILGTIRDGADSHKHGWLDRPSAIFVSKGQRPDTASGHGFFVGETPLGELTHFTYVGLRKNDGTTVRVHALLRQAEEAWEHENQTLGLWS